VGVIRAMVELAPDVRARADHLRASPRARLGEVVWTGTRDGGAFESPFVHVVELDAAGKAVRLDFYDPHHLDRAQARFDEIGRAASAAPRAVSALANAATAALDGWAAVFDGGASVDWDAVRASCAPDLVFEDRQGFARLSGDRELMLASLRERTANGGRAEGRLIGTAGDRVAVVRMLWSGGPAEGRFEIEYVSVVEVDASGRMTASILFGPDDVRAAQREAWARWAAIDPMAADLTTLMGEAIDAFNAHDRARYRAILADDLVVEDHRRTGMGRLEGGDAYADSVAVLWQLAGTARVEGAWLWPALERHGGVTVLRRYGTVADGGPYESEFLWLFILTGGRLTRVEMFETEDLGAALARLAELSAAAPPRR